MKAFDLYPHKCMMCGKNFEAGPEYAYKYELKKNGKMLWFCSWHCLQNYRADSEHAKNAFSKEQEFEWND